MEIMSIKFMIKMRNKNYMNIIARINTSILVPSVNRARC